MTFARTVACVVVALVLLPARPDAHHSFAADFDITTPVTLTGRVTTIEWLNPHVHIALDVTENAKTVTWSIELGSPNGLKQRGWTPKSLNVGDVVTVDGSLAKDGSRLANARSVRLPSGVRLWTGAGEGKTS